MVTLLDIVAKWAVEKGWWVFVPTETDHKYYPTTEDWINISKGGPPFEGKGRYTTMWASGAISRTPAEYLRLRPEDPNFFRDLEVYLEGTE